MSCVHGAAVSAQIYDFFVFTEEHHFYISLSTMMSKKLTLVPIFWRRRGRSFGLILYILASCVGCTCVFLNDLAVWYLCFLRTSFRAGQCIFL